MQTDCQVEYIRWGKLIISWQPCCLSEIIYQYKKIYLVFLSRAISDQCYYKCKGGSYKCWVPTVTGEAGSMGNKIISQQTKKIQCDIVVRMLD